MPFKRLVWVGASSSVWIADGKLVLPPPGISRAFLIGDFHGFNPKPSDFYGEMTKSRRLFSWAGERRRRPFEPQLASPLW